MRRLDLCSGYDAATLVFDAPPVAVAETDPHASALHHQHHPDVPNLGDITTADWTDLADNVDLITAGFPCQPISQAGQQKGIDDDRWLWPDVARAVRDVRPGWVFLENVPRLLTINDGDAMAAVMHDLAVLGFDAEWGTVAASDVGACHRRNRWWCLARHADRVGRAGGPAERGPHRGPVVARAGGGAGPVDLPPTPVVSYDGKTAEQHLAKKNGHDGARRVTPTDLRIVVEELLPTATTEVTEVTGHSGTTGGMALPDAIHALLPTPEASDGTGSRRATNLRWEGNTAYRPSGAKASISIAEAVDALVNIGDVSTALRDRYGPAIARHEHTFARPAPSPVIHNPKARKGVSLNPVFVEWMMGLPEGWVTGRGLPRTAELRALGNGWVPAQARAALDVLAGHMREELAA